MVLNTLTMLINKINNGYIPSDSAVERQRPCPAQGRSSTLPTTKQDRHPTVSETHFTKKTHSQIPQYSTYYTNQPFKMSSAKEASSTEPNYSFIQTTVSSKLQSHPNPLLQTISRDNIPRRLKRRWPADL